MVGRERGRARCTLSSSSAASDVYEGQGGRSRNRVAGTRGLTEAGWRRGLEAGGGGEGGWGKGGEHVALVGGKCGRDGRSGGCVGEHGANWHAVGIPLGQ